MIAMANLVVMVKVILKILKRRIERFYTSMIFLLKLSILLFAYLAIFSSIFKSCNILIIIWRTHSNFSSHACKDFYSYKMILIRSNVTLIIIYKYVFSLFKIAFII